MNPDLADSIVKATCILCNYLHHGVEGQAGMTVLTVLTAPHVDRRSKRPRGNRASAEALRIRDTFKQYFASPAGQLTWQYNRVCHGLID